MKKVRAPDMASTAAADLGLLEVIAQFKSAESLLTRYGDTSFIFTRLADSISHGFKLLNDVSDIWRITRAHKSSLATWSMWIELAFTLRYYIGWFTRNMRRVTAITDENYRRSHIMHQASSEAGAQDQVSHKICNSLYLPDKLRLGGDQVLGLRKYYYEEYKKAQEAVGDASPNRPDVMGDDFEHPYRSILWKVLEKANGSILYML